MKHLNKWMKFSCCLLMLFIFNGCSFLGEKEEQPETKREIVNENENKDFVDPYIDDNPIQLGLYVHQNSMKTLTSNYDSSFTKYQDMVSFEVYYTQESVLSGNQKELWKQYVSNYEGIADKEIGYHISFETTSSGKIEKNILVPDDVWSFFDYVQVYLYDDIHQESSWYDHVTKEEVTDTTILTSIKLTASIKIDEIISPITLTVFTYDSDDFDESGNYRGNSTYQVVIQRK